MPVSWPLLVSVLALAGCSPAAIDPVVTASSSSSGEPSTTVPTSGPDPSTSATGTDTSTGTGASTTGSTGDSEASTASTGALDSDGSTASTGTSTGTTDTIGTTSTGETGATTGTTGTGDTDTTGTTGTDATDTTSTTGTTTGGTGEFAGCVEPTDSDTAADPTMWSRQIGGTFNTMFGRLLQVDPAGAVIVADRFRGPTDLGGGVVVADFNHGWRFVNKYAGDGAYLWSRVIGSDEGELTEAALAVDCAGNIFMAGGFFGALDIDGQTFTAVPGVDVQDDLAFSTDDAFVAKFDPGGGLVWFRSFGDDEYQQFIGLVTTDSGGVVVVGRVRGVTELGGAPVLADSSHDGLVAEFDADGAHVWHRSFAGAKDIELARIVRAADGRLTLAGTAWADVDLGGGPLPFASEPWVLAQLEPDGAHRWSRRFVPGHDVRGLAGYDEGSTVLVGGRLDNDMFVVRVDAAGQVVWTRSAGVGPGEHALAWDVAIGPSGDVAVVGDFAGTLDFGGGAVASKDLAKDMFLVRYTAAGDFVTHTAFAGTNTEEARAVRFGPDGELVMTGNFSGQIDLGAGVLTATGGSDQFIRKFAP